MLALPMSSVYCEEVAWLEGMIPPRRQEDVTLKRVKAHTGPFSDAHTQSRSRALYYWT